jgi:hypothetical protein
MIAFNRYTLRCLCVMGAVILSSERAGLAEVVDIAASAFTRVEQFDAGEPFQENESDLTFPGSDTSMPLESQSRLERHGGHGEKVSVGECFLVVHDPRVEGAVPPDDIGVDLASFSIDGRTTYLLTTKGSETRTVVLKPEDVGTRPGPTHRVRSLLSLAGAFVVVSEESLPDLTGMKLEMKLRILKGGSILPLIQGGATWTGGPNGALILSTSGAINPFWLVNFNLLDSITTHHLGFARTLVFPSLPFVYEYFATVDEAFDLTLELEVIVETSPGNHGAAAVFGKPQRALGDILEDVLESDEGKLIEEAVADLLDTTAGPLIGPYITIFALPGWCSIFGLESGLMGMLGVFYYGGLRIRRRGR